MNLETKITIYKFTPQVFTLTRKMHLIFFRHGNTNYTENTDFLYSSSVNSV